MWANKVCQRRETKKIVVDLEDEVGWLLVNTPLKPSLASLTI